jgi:transcriptional regulator GlxA family with amidase domain
MTGGTGWIGKVPMARMATTMRGWEDLAVAARYDARELAKLCDLSVRQLEREFQRQLARTPQDWLNEQRIKAAQQMLLSGQPVKKVALDLGFKQVSHFCRQFKIQNNITPTQFAAFIPSNPECRSQIIIHR